MADELGKARKHPDLQFFSLSTIIVATSNFHFENKLGEGGFGSVYKASPKLDVLKISSSVSFLLSKEVLKFIPSRNSLLFSLLPSVSSNFTVLPLCETLPPNHYFRVSYQVARRLL